MKMECSEMKTICLASLPKAEYGVGKLQDVTCSPPDTFISAENSRNGKTSNKYGRRDGLQMASCGSVGGTGTLAHQCDSGISASHGTYSRKSRNNHSGIDCFLADSAICVLQCISASFAPLSRPLAVADLSLPLCHCNAQRQTTQEDA